MARLDDFRRKYPEYDDVPDQQLADALHAKYYSDVPLDQYYSQLGLVSEPVDPIAPEDDTTFLGALGEAGKRALGGVYTGGVDVLGGLGQLAPGIDDQSMVDMSRTARAETAKALGYDPAYSEDFITEDGFDADRFVAQLGGVIGNMAPQVAALVFVPGERERRLARFATFIGQSVSEGGEERPEDLTTFQRLADKGGDIGLALLEPLGLDRVVRGVPKGFFQSPEGNPFLRRIESMLRSGIAEGVQETAQGIARDLKALAIYDPDREIADSAVEDFTLGGGAGAFFDFAINAAMGGNRRTRKVEAPKEITEPTEDQIAEEERARAEKLEQEAARVATKDAELAAAAREPSAVPDRMSSLAIDPELDTEEIVTEIQRRQSVPAGAMFEVEGRDGTYIVSQNGNQFGPAMKDPIKAQEVKARLSEESDNLRVDAVIDAHIAETGGRGPEPDIRVLKSLAGKGLIEQSLVDEEIRRQEQNRKTRDLEEAGNKALARMVSEGRISQEAFDGLMKGRMRRFYQSIRDSGRRFTPEEPTKPRLAARRATAEPAPVVNLMERRIDTALNRKGVANRINSKEGSGVVQTIVGRPVSESKPLSDLTRSEMDYVLQAIEQAPQITTPRGTGVDQVDPVTGVTVPSRPRMIGPEAAIFIPNFADVAKPAQPEVRTEPVEKGKELALFDPDAEAKAVDRQLESAVNKQVQDILKSVGIDGDYAAKIVNQVGTASRDSAGNVYITPPEKPQTGKITTMGSAQSGAKVIQIALDGVKQRVDQGMSFEEATAMAMNHELVHALRAMDLFTAQEFSLLERLTRQYGKPGTNQTYAQWAVSTYATRKDPEKGQEVPQDAVIQQEEAIAEMLSDAMTKGVLIDGDVRKVGGKPQSLIRRIINLFKRLVGYARDNDINSYKELVNRIQSGEVGARERGVVRTLMQTEKNIGQVQERAVTTEDLQLVTGTRPTQEQITAIAANLKEQVGQMVADNPELDPNIGKRAIDTPDEVLESRVAEAANQRFRVNIPYYHGTATDPLVDGGRGIRRFQGKLGMGVVAGHFAENPKFASGFAPQVMTYQREYPVVYPVFLRYGEDNEVGGLFEVRSAIQDEDNPVSRSINRTLNNQPELKSNLESYFANELEKGKQFGPDKTKLKSFEQADIARFYYEGVMPLQEASERLAEDFHNWVAPQTYRMIVEDPYGIDFTQLEPLAPYMKEAGFVGYYDIERPGDPYSAVAMFNSEDIKGMFARFDPESVPEGGRYEDDIMYSRRLEGMPETFDVDGQAVEFGYHQPAVDAARRYAEKAGMRYEPLTEYAPIDERMARKIAIEYDEMQDAPNDPEVKAAYDAMINETLAQYEEILNSGLTVQFIKGDDPYGNPRNAILDVINNNHMYVFSTRDGYGMDGITQKDLASNPMLRETKYKTADGDPMLANDVFRVVHDYFGHIKNGVGFRARGEENAWQSHAAMYSPLARRAMTSETRGQNSWVNFGPSASFNATANGADTVYADQKTGLLPLWVSEEARQSDPRRADARVFQEGLEGAIGEDGKLKISHFGRRRITRTDPEMAGRGADRTRRYAPKGTYFGIVEADENGYRRETILGDVEHKFSVDPLLVYPLDKDPYNLVAVNPARNLDWDTTLKALNDNGFIGFRVDDKQIGKVVFINQPLIPDEVVDQTPREKPQTKDIQTKKIAPIRSIDPAQIEKAVAQNQQEAERAGTTVPLYSVKASPEAQYIARNPEAAIVPDEILESRDPEYRPETKSFIGRLVTDRPERVDPMQQYMDATGDNSPLSYKLTKARQAILNRYARLEKLNQKYFNNYLADSSSIAAVLFADRSAGVTAEAFKSGVPQYKNGLTKVVDFSHNGKKYRGLIDIIDLLRTKKYGDLTQFAQAYAIAMRGKRLNDDGKVTPVTEADYQQALRDVEQYTDANGNNPVKEWYEAWQAYNNQVITFLQDTGVLNEQTAEDWRLAADYIPYYRALDPEAEIGKVVTNAYGDLRKLGAFKAYKGKTDKINVPLVEAITKNVGSAIDLGMRNVAQQRIARDMQKLQLATQVPASRKNDAAVIGFKVRGEPVYFQIHDPLILESMSAIESSGLENLSRMYFGPLSSLLRETVTRTPGFMIANLLRDSLSAFVTSGARFLPWIDTTKGYFEDVNRLERTGVVGGYDFNVDQKDLGKLFEEESANRKRRGLPLNIIRTMWRFAGRQTTRSDAATRQAVYNDVYSRTGNEAEAHYQAMEILNFSRRGSNGVMRAIATAVPFLNARIQGLDVLYRGALGVNPANRELTQNRAIIGFAMRGALLGFATALYWAQVSDEEEYREASRELKDNNWLFPVPWLEDVGAIAIPIPFEVGLIFKTIPEVVLDTTWGERTGKQAFESGKQAVLSTLNFNPVPQALTPLLEAITNYDVYTGRPIVPVWMTGQRPEMQRTDATTELALLLQKATIPLGGGGASPMKIDHIIRGYTGGTGVFVTSWLDRIVRDPTVTEGLDAIGYTVKQPEMSALATYDYPVVKRFLTSPEGTGLKEQFYDLYNEVRQDYNSMNALIRDGRQDELDALIPKIGYLAEVKDGVYSLKKELDNIRMMRRGIMRSDLDAEMKKEQLDALREYENDILSVTPLLESLANRSVIRGL